MKLLHGGLSPFVRKVMILAHEKNIVRELELEASPVNPLQPMESVIKVNPLGKIPALVLNNGSAIYGSTLICEYLDENYPVPKFFPRGDDRWTALRLNNLADGILEAGNLVRIESLRPDGLKWQQWEEVQVLKVRNALDALENEARNLKIDNPSIGEVATACALGWLEVRLEQIAWQDNRPNLVQWYKKISERPSLEATAPKVPNR